MNKIICALALLAVRTLNAQYPLVTVPPPAAPTVNVQPNGQTGFTPYYYMIVAHYPSGTAQSQIVSTPNGNATLSLINNNQIGWNALPGALSYDILSLGSNTFTGSCTCLLANVAGTSYTDIGNAALSYTIGAPALGANAQWYLDNTDFAFPKLRINIGNANSGGVNADHLAEIPAGTGLPVYARAGDLFILTGSSPAAGCYVALVANVWTPCAGASASGNALTNWHVTTLGVSQPFGVGAAAPLNGNVTCNALYRKAGIPCVNGY